MHSESTQKVLLTKAKLTSEKVVEISQGMEAAAQQSKELNKGSHCSSPVFTVQTPGKTPCGRCGRGNHSKHECKFRNAVRHKLSKVGHIAPVCRSKISGKSPKAPTRRAKWLTTDDSADSDSASDSPPDQDTAEEPQPLFVITNKSSPPYKVKLEVNGHPLEMEVDTGAAVSLAPESAVAALLATTQLQPSNIVLKTYTGEQIPVKGVMSVEVRYGQQHHRELKLLIVQGNGPCLLGRDWLKVVRLDWRNIGKVSTSANLESCVAALQNRYQEVFSEKLGTITPFQAKLSVAPNTQLKFFKPRTVPFALKEQIESELD